MCIYLTFAFVNTIRFRWYFIFKRNRFLVPLTRHFIFKLPRYIQYSNQRNKTLPESCSSVSDKTKYAFSATVATHWTFQFEGVKKCARSNKTTVGENKKHLWNCSYWGNSSMSFFFPSVELWIALKELLLVLNMRLCSVLFLLLTVLIMVLPLRDECSGLTSRSPHTSLLLL